MIERRNLHFALSASAEVPCKRKTVLAGFILCFVSLGFGRTASFIGKLSRKMADVNANPGYVSALHGHAAFRHPAIATSHCYRQNASQGAKAFEG